MQKLTLFPALTQSLKPMLAHILDPRGDVFVRTRVAEGAVAFLEVFADGPSGEDSESVFALQEGAEGECVGGWVVGRVENLEDYGGFGFCDHCGLGWVGLVVGMEL